MKNSLLWLALLLPMLSFSQNIPATITLPPGYTVSESRLKAVLDSVHTAWGITNTKPDPIKANCEEGPEIRLISNITTTSMSVLFHGEGVTKLVADIWQGTTKKASVYIEPESAIIFIPYGVELVPGNYILVISGVICNGTSTQAFIIPPKDIGEVEPGEPEQPQPPVISSNKFCYGLPAHLDFQLKDGVYYDAASGPAPDGFEYLYCLNAEVIRTKYPITNYFYNSIIPLSVRKVKIRTNEPYIYPAGNGRIEILSMFDPNTSISISTIISK